MTSDLQQRPDTAGLADPAPAGGRGLRHALIAVIAVAVLALAGAGGYLLRGPGPAPSTTPAADSVDAGFARDMATHHQQAVSMAGYVRDNSSDASVRLLAFDIESSQQFQVGQMDGWLASWNLSRTSSLPMMSWMKDGMNGMTMPTAGSSDGALMPGMATNTELARLRTLHGTALDVLFLQLMLRHHQGGVDMAGYAAKHATEPYVRTLAQQMVNNQTNEITQMKQMLAARGASPLPFN